MWKYHKWHEQTYSHLLELIPIPRIPVESFDRRIHPFIPLRNSTGNQRYVIALGFVVLPGYIYNHRIVYFYHGFSCFWNPRFYFLCVCAVCWRWTRRRVSRWMTCSSTRGSPRRPTTRCCRRPSCTTGRRSRRCSRRTPSSSPAWGSPTNRSNSNPSSAQTTPSSSDVNSEWRPVLRVSPVKAYSHSANANLCISVHLAENVRDRFCLACE